MDSEEVKDFSALRAKFQNNSNFLNTAVCPKKTVMEISKKSLLDAVPSSPTTVLPNMGIPASLNVVIKELQEKPSFAKESPLKCFVKHGFVREKPAIPSKPIKMQVAAKSNNSVKDNHTEQISAVCRSVSSEACFPKPYLQTKSKSFNTVNKHNTEEYENEVMVKKSFTDCQKTGKATTLPSRCSAVSEWNLQTFINKAPLDDQVVKRGTSMINVDVNDTKHLICDPGFRKEDSLPYSDGPPKPPPKTYTAVVVRKSSENDDPAIPAALPKLLPKMYAKVDCESCESDVPHILVAAVRKDACLPESVDTKNSSSQQKRPNVNSRVPKKKTLPPLHQIGPPPKKSDRPPNVDLSCFLHIAQHIDYASKPPVPPSLSLQTPHCDLPSFTAVFEEENAYLPPDNDEFTSSSIYEETENILYKKWRDSQENYSSDPPRKSFHTEGHSEDSMKTEIQENSKAQKRISEHYHPGLENILLGETRIGKNEEDGKQYVDLEKEQKAKEEKEQKSRRRFNITGLEGTLYSAEIMDDTKGGKFDLPLKKGAFVDVIRTTACPSGKWLAKDKNGNFGYIPVSAVKVDEQDIKMIGCRLSMQFQNNEELYDDADSGSVRDTMMHYLSSFSSDSFADDNSEEAYEDIGNVQLSGDINSATKNNKKLLKFFKMEKEKKVKGKDMSENVADHVPFTGTNQEGQDDVYADAETVKNVKKDKGEKDGKHKMWIKKFHKKDEHINRGKDECGSEESFCADTSSSPKSSLKSKTPDGSGRGDDDDDKLPKSAKEKLKKAAKEEKLFREKFEYTRDINVINKAVVDSNVTQGKKDKLHLSVKPGEILDVIDTTEENKVICRNSDGKFGFVLVEHLNFTRLQFE